MGVGRNTHKNCFRKSKENKPLAGSRSAHKMSLICILKLKAGTHGFVFGQAAVPIFSDRTISDCTWSQAQSSHSEAPIKPLSTSVGTQVWKPQQLNREFSWYLLVKNYKKCCPVTSTFNYIGQSSRTIYIKTLTCFYLHLKCNSQNSLVGETLFWSSICCKTTIYFVDTTIWYI